MNTTGRRPRADEHGAILIHVAVSMLLLLAFSAFAVDYGVFWVARGQSQNAADMAALAAAVAWAYDSPENATAAKAAARESAVAVAQQNPVWFAPPSINAASNVTFYIGTCPSGTPAGDCVRVDLFRDTAHGSALPTYFGNLLGVGTQDVRATATAGVMYVSASECLAPIALPDRWVEHWDKDKAKESTFDPEKAKFEKYCEDNAGCGAKQPNNDFSKGDVYIPPGRSGATGYRFTDPPSTKQLKLDDFVLKFDKKKDALKDFEPRGNRYLVLDVPRVDGLNGMTGYAQNFQSCNAQAVRIGDDVGNIPVESTKKDAVSDATGKQIEALYNLDPGASWKDGRVINSCAQANPPCAAAKNGVSPRVLTLPLFDVDRYTDCMTGRISCDDTKVRIVNMVGLFIQPPTDKKSGAFKLSDLKKGKFEGYMMPVPGVPVGGGSIDKDFSFLRAMVMVR